MDGSAGISQHATSTEKDDEDWLKSAPLWTSNLTSPFMPHVSQSLALDSQFRDGDVLTSTFSMLSKLSNVDPIHEGNRLPKGEVAHLIRLRRKYLEGSLTPCDVVLGEGTTFRVEQQRWMHARPSGEIIEVLVATKKAKSMVPKAMGEKIAFSAADHRRLKAVLLEIEILSHAPLQDHPNIAQLLGYTTNYDLPGYAPTLVMELAVFGCLNILLHHETLSGMELKQICADVASGLELIHNCLIVHGDVKQENILIFPDPQRRFVAKISDFEHALLDRQEVHYAGTPIYNAPEVHAQGHIGHSAALSKCLQIDQPALCDVFSYGLLTFEILSHGKRYYELPETEDFRQCVVQNPQCTEIIYLDFVSCY